MHHIIHRVSPSIVIKTPEHYWVWPWRPPAPPDGPGISKTTETDSITFLGSYTEPPSWLAKNNWWHPGSPEHCMGVPPNQTRSNRTKDIV